MHAIISLLLNEGRVSMAKIEAKLRAKVEELSEAIKDQVLSASASAHLEDYSEFKMGDASCFTYVFERYSYIGSNRVSMSVTLFEKEDHILLSAISSGGSEAIFFKINTFGEEAFLDTLRPLLDDYQAERIDSSN